MRIDLNNKFLEYIENNDCTNIYYSINNACKAELIDYIYNHSLLLNEELEEEIINRATELIYKRVVFGYKIGKRKGKKLRPTNLGAYCYQVVLFEYKRYIKKYLDEKDYLDKIKEEIYESRRQ